MCLQSIHLQPALAAEGSASQVFQGKSTSNGACWRGSSFGGKVMAGASQPHHGIVVQAAVFHFCLVSPSGEWSKLFLASPVGCITVDHSFSSSQDFGCMLSVYRSQSLTTSASCPRLFNLDIWVEQGCWLSDDDCISCAADSSLHRVLEDCLNNEMSPLGKR